MLLAIDVGNTNLTLGVFRGEQLLHDWRLKTSPWSSGGRALPCAPWRRFLGLDSGR